MAARVGGGGPRQSGCVLLQFDHHRARGPAPRERGAPYGSDLRLYAAAGVPTLHYGPGDVRLAHSPQESVPIDELVTVTEALVLALVRACS